jgi:hypothetical protein
MVGPSRRLQFNPNNTIGSYALYYSTSRTRTTQFESCSINLNNYSWNSGTQYNLYIQAVGIPTIANHMSPVAVYTP